MSLDAARLSEIRGIRNRPITDEHGETPPEWIADLYLALPDLLAAHEALTAQVVALTAALERAVRLAEACPVQVMSQRSGESFPAAYTRSEIEQREQIAELEAALADTAAAAEAFKRQQRREGARELARRFLSHPQTMADALADMERETSA